ncbi:hypothetical protein LX99_01423 [Mucilaginibacter oryzae]|uniref:Outer membrane protein with beta-barrel domain n=1 Tax=Mucilaginibacter oryzae TaxID=468058 RepID=A0A316HCN3_9SPHI|nr:hypothetical protein [Mucilaginibacter oryzae]PWK78969.1 hypothetical protein LX99_01423 [Mucilaginibacter oryzae]
MKSEEDLDKLFKRSMEDPANHRAFNEDDWDAFEQMFDAGKKRRGIVYWLPLAGGIAAMLLLALGWWFFVKPVKTIDNGQMQTGVKPTVTKPATPSVTRGGDISQQPQDSTANTDQRTQNMVVTKSQKDSARNLQSRGRQLALGENRQHTYGNKQLALTTTARSGSNNMGGKRVPAKNTHSTDSLENKAQMAGIGPARGTFAYMLANQGYSLHITQVPMSSPDFKTQIDIPTTAPNPDKPAKKMTKQSLGYRPQWAVTALASSDVNGTNTFQGKVGSNYGALLSLAATKKLTITSGVVYSSKPYTTSFANYNTSYVFKNQPTDVLADCKMLDIPINIAYQVYGNFRNKVSVGTGLSSYIMLHEKYTFTYAGYVDPESPQNYTVPNSKGYYLSILNLNATYEHRINSKFGISVQPYMKVPLSGVGYSDLKLQSTGVAVGVTYNINAFRKP